MPYRYPEPDLENIAVGFHDDSFGAHTLPTVNWHFLSRMKEHGLEQLWQHEPIGGELRPATMAALDNALAAHTWLGYDLIATKTRIQPNAHGTTVSLEVKNQGVAAGPSRSASPMRCPAVIR